MGVREGIAVGIAAALAAAAPAAAQLPSLPPVGQPPPGGQPQPPPGQPQQPPAPPGSGSGTSSLQVDVAHTGFFADDALVPPLQQRWRIQAAPSNLLAADGRVFLLGSTISARDQGDGHELWSAAVAGRDGGAYADGVLFVAADGKVHALKADTGALLWTFDFGDVGFTGPPVAGGGVVYASHGGSGQALYAIRASDGQRLWGPVSTINGAFAPALDDTRLYVAGACGKAAAHNRSDGQMVWEHRTACSGGTTTEPALFGGRLWAPEREATESDYLDPPIFDAASGSVVGRHPDTRVPVFVDGLAVSTTPQKGSRAIEVSSGRAVWSSKVDVVAPIAIGHDVYGLDTEPGQPTIDLNALDAETGAVLWGERLENVGSSNHFWRTAALPGLLVVAVADTVVAYESVFKPAADGVEIGAGRFDVVAGARTEVVGVVGTSLRGARPAVGIEAAPARRGSFLRAGQIPTARDGGFSGPLRVVRNTRIRGVVGSAASAPLTVYAWPSVALGRARPAGSRIRVPVTAKTPATRLGGRTFVLYLDRKGDNKGLQRLASARLRGGKRARGTLVFKPLRRVGSKDALAVCIRGGLSIDLGRPSPLTRRCGARRLAQG